MNIEKIIKQCITNGFIVWREHIMVIGVNHEDLEIYFITAYQPTLDIWEVGFERRKSR